jgi:hypothetical protein
MNKDLFERLLYEEESSMIDFKKEQYRSAKNIRAELLSSCSTCWIARGWKP